MFVFMSSLKAGRCL